MKTDDEILIKALEILSSDIQSDDGVANACIAEAAQRLRELIAPVNVNMFKRGQVWEDESGELIMICSTCKRGDDYKVEYVHEGGYLGSFYASKFRDCKKYSEPVQVRNYDLTKCPKCGGEADNGIDRGYPPQPYNCKKCHGEGPYTEAQKVGDDKQREGSKYRFDVKIRCAISEFVSKRKYKTVFDAQKGLADLILKYFSIDDCYIYERYLMREADKAATVSPEQVEKIKWAMNIAICERQNLERSYPDLFEALPILEVVAGAYLETHAS